jgi:N-acetylmuramic acid 6-phosphate etherase
MGLDRLTSGAAIDLLLNEDAWIPAAIRRLKPQLQRALRLIHRALSTGGRLLYVGAGTSGRLGVLDASECPPTFRTPPEWVQGIIAGGAEAVFRAVEGAEDDLPAGRRAIEFRNVSRRDVVVGIAASGRTPFVWGALAEARQRGAATVLICFNPHLAFAPGHRPDVVLAPEIGPELLTGSTRLKAGTATKLMLNLLTTLTMVRLGKVVSNLMVDLNPANAKLRDRAIRITRELTGADEATAREQLIRSGWIVKDAVKVLSPRSRRQRQA